MMNLRILQRNPVSNYFTLKTITAHFSNGKSSSSSSSDDEKDKDPIKKRSEEALRKLNLLLNKMIQKDTSTSTSIPKLDLAKPVDKRKKAQAETEVDSGTNIVAAVKEVAKVVGGDAKQTESELLQKLLNPVKEEPTSNSSTNLSQLFKDMKIDREGKQPDIASRSQQVRQLLQNSITKNHYRPKGTVGRASNRHSGFAESTEDQIIEERVNLFGNESIGIFPCAADVKAWPKQDFNKTWNALEERELKLAVTHPPANYFQQMIQWTEQGKIWKFPIDNEQAMDAERSVCFTEHVFLDKHIESWCPTKGPIRHFMELVLVGLSKNPYLSVEHKKEHIDWFKNYFNDKKALLHEVGAIPANFEFLKEDMKKLES